MNSKPSGSANETLYGIVTGDGTVTSKNGDTYTMYNIWTGKDTVVYVDGDAQDSLNKGALVSFDESADQTYTQTSTGSKDFTVLDGTDTAKGQAIAVTDYNEKDKTITFASALKVDGDAYVENGKTTKAIDNDVKIVYINADKDKAGDDGMGITSFDGTTGYANALIVYEDNINTKKVVAIIVNTNSDTDVLGNKAPFGLYAMPTTATVTGLDATASVSRTGNVATIVVTAANGKTFGSEPGTYKLKVNGTDASVTPTKDADNKTLTFTYTATANVTSFEVCK